LIPYENILEIFFGIKTQLKPYRLVSIFILFIVICKVIKNRKIIFKLNSSDISLYAMFVVGLIVTFLNYYFDSRNFDDSIFFNYLFQIVLAIVLYSMIRSLSININLFVKFFNFYIIGLVINCIFLIIQSYFLVETLDYKRPAGFISNPNSAGLQMAVGIFYLVFSIKNNNSRVKQILNVLVIILFTIGIFQTQSRTSLFLVTLICLISFYNLSIVRKIQIGAIVIIMIFIFGGVILNSEMFTRIQRKSKSNRPDERIELWNKSIELGIDSKFLGIGIGQFQRRSYARKYFSNTNFPTLRSELRKGEIGLGLHNTFLHILINYGFLSFILFIIFIFSTNRKLFFELKKRSFKADTIEYFKWGAFFFILFFSFTGELLLFPYFWVMFALFNSEIIEN
jgi:teichuronic acid biosynthesis protein TuaE